MFAYSPEKFTSLYASALGQRIWAFLTKAENVARLETASELGKPAVEGIEEQLLAEFREEVLADRVKQRNLASIGICIGELSRNSRAILANRTRKNAPGAYLLLTQPEILRRAIALTF